MTSQNESSKKPIVAVIGGGMAGLSACSVLVAHGMRVILIEASKVFGGRAASYLNGESEEILDLGPHTLVESNRNVLDHLHRVGTRHQIEISATLTVRFVHPARGIAVFRCPKWQSRWALVWGIMTYRFLPFPDRIRSVRFGWYLAALDDGGVPDITIEEAFRRRDISTEARQVFWDPLVVATLNDDPASLSLQSLARILRLGFLASETHIGLGIPQTDWSRLLTGNLPDQIIRSGGQVLTRQRVQKLWIDEGRVKGVILCPGQRLRANGVISAVPPRNLASLISDEPSWLAPALRFNWSPIVSLHWVGVNPLPVDTPMVLLGSPVQWIFSRMPLKGNKGVILSTVTGGNRELSTKPSAEIIKVLRGEIRRYFPRWEPGEGSQVVLHRVRRATCTLGPSQEYMRPTQATDIPGLWIAGDWTRTSLPPTLESAALSGVMAAREFLETTKFPE
jgi:squalene-associated FAD-dependent desaturase